MSKKLLPCPFCGGAAEFERKGNARHSCIVVCTDCGARHESGDAEWNSGSSWNRRASGTRAVTEEMVERGCVALATEDENTWERLDETVRDAYRTTLRNILTAALRTERPRE